MAGYFLLEASSRRPSSRTAREPNSASNRPRRPMPASGNAGTGVIGVPTDSSDQSLLPLAGSVFAVDDSAPGAGRRARHPHAAGCGQAAALQPRRGRGVARPGRCPEALAGCSQAAAMLLVFVRLGTVPGRTSMIFLSGLRVRCRCSAALDRRDARSLAAAGGAVLSGSVNSRTTILVVGVPSPHAFGAYDKSAKHRKAEALIEAGVPLRILSELDFRALVAC